MFSTKFCAFGFLNLHLRENEAAASKFVSSLTRFWAPAVEPPTVLPVLPEPALPVLPESALPALSAPLLVLLSTALGRRLAAKFRGNRRLASFPRSVGRSLASLRGVIDRPRARTFTPLSIVEAANIDFRGEGAPGAIHVTVLPWK